MIKVDLITGFLGSGKTTFLKSYAKYLVDIGEKICIIENDFGAINVDMVLLSELMSDKCNIEMIVGGDGKEAHKRRLKTKLIAMGMQGYDRVIIEPSGIYDLDEFFDVLYEEPLDRWYEIGNVIALVDAQKGKELSKESRYIQMAEVSWAGMIVLSKLDSLIEKDCEYKNAPNVSAAIETSSKEIISGINNLMKEFECKREFKNEDYIAKKLEDYTEEDFKRISNAGYKKVSYTKQVIGEDEGYQTIFYFDFAMEKNDLEVACNHVFKDEDCGKVHRIKGFILNNDGSKYELNATRNEIGIKPVVTEKCVLIVIGEQLNRDRIAKYFGKPTL